MLSKDRRTQFLMGGMISLLAALLAPLTMIPIPTHAFIPVQPRPSPSTMTASTSCPIDSNCCQNTVTATEDAKKKLKNNDKREDQRDAPIAMKRVAASMAIDDPSLFVFPKALQDSSSPTTRTSIIQKSWEALLPPLFTGPAALFVGQPSSSLDVTIQWDPQHESPQQAAHKLLLSLLDKKQQQKEVLSLPDKDSVMMESTLKTSLSRFRSFCDENILLRNETTDSDGNEKSSLLQARLVVTRGGRLGAKCPKWHVDHVPFRWIQSIVGPGCEVVLGDEGVCREAFLTPADPLYDKNGTRVDDTMATIWTVPATQAVILVGKLWNEWCTGGGGSAARMPRATPEEDSASPQQQKQDVRRSAAIHKSPSKMSPWQGRILLTQDVIEL